MKDLTKTAKNIEKRGISVFSGRFHFDGTETFTDTEFLIGTLPKRSAVKSMLVLCPIKDGYTRPTGTVKVTHDDGVSVTSIDLLSTGDMPTFVNTLDSAGITMKFDELPAPITMTIPGFVPGAKHDFRVIIEYYEVDLTNGQWTA